MTTTIDLETFSKTCLCSKLFWITLHFWNIGNFCFKIPINRIKRPESKKGYSKTISRSFLAPKQKKLSNIRVYKTEVTSVKLVLFKYVMSFETLTKVDQLTEILRFWLGFKPKNKGKSWSGNQMITKPEWWWNEF